MTTIRQLIADGTITLDTVVLGKLVVTVDGCLVGTNATTFWAGRNGIFPNKWILVNQTNQWRRSDEVYSTREAAEASRKGTP